MAITVDWDDKIIHVPRADLTLIQSSPTEIRELDLNWFRLKLKELESAVEGAVFPDTHRHNAAVNVGGVTLAMVVEIINDYTVTFEDGQYAVNLVGANSNVGDRVNVNSVSIRSANSAGMTSSAAIEYASFNGGVSVDLDSPYSGTVFPKGTPQQPVNNFEDALLIAGVRGFSTFFIIGDATLDTSLDFRGFSFIGESQIKSSITIGVNAQVEGCEFYEATIQGTLDGNALLKNCKLNTLAYINGTVEQCVLHEGVITLGGSNEALFIDCWSGEPSMASVPVIDMGGSGQDLMLRNYNGGIKIRNLTGPSNRIGIDLNSGQVELEATITAGTVTVRGVGILTDNSTGAAIVNGADLLNSQSIEAAVVAGVQGLETQLARVLGLNQENYYLDQTVVNDEGRMTSCRLRTYTLAASVGSNNNVLATYLVTAQWDGTQLLNYKVVKSA